MVVKRFDVYLINLDPTIGREIKKTRLVKRLGQINTSTQKEVLTLLAEMFAE